MRSAAALSLRSVWKGTRAYSRASSDSAFSGAADADASASRVQKRSSSRISVRVAISRAPAPSSFCPARSRSARSRATTELMVPTGPDVPAGGAAARVSAASVGKISARPIAAPADSATPPRRATPRAPRRVCSRSRSSARSRAWLITAASAVARTTSSPVNVQEMRRCSTSTPDAVPPRRTGTASSAGNRSSPRPGMYLKCSSLAAVATDTGRRRSATKPVIPSPMRRRTRPTASAGKPTLPRIVKTCAPASRPCTPCASSRT